MTQVNHMKRFGVALLGAAVLTGTAHAAGTDAGTTVSNTFTLNYDVGGTAQPPIDNSGSPTQFTVDRLVDLTITELNPTLNVAPGSVAADNEVVFRLTNLGNDTQAYDLSTAVPSGTYAPGSIAIEYFIDLDGSTTLNGGEVVVVGTQPDDVPPDINVYVTVQSSVPGVAVDGQTANLVLIADTLHATNPIASCGSCTPLAEVLADAGGNTLAGEAETFLADLIGVATMEANNAGDFSAQSVLTVLAPTLTASKSVAVFQTAPATEGVCTGLTTPVAGDQYSVPGACIQYEIEIINTGAGDASNLVIADELPAEIRFLQATLDAGFVDDTSIAGAGPILAAPGSPVDCNGTSNCTIQLSDALLAGGTTGKIFIWGLVQ